MVVLVLMLLVGASIRDASLIPCSLSDTEIAFVGKAPGTYSMLLGGGYYGQRLNKIYRG
jgi:hypothetical protein